MVIADRARGLGFEGNVDCETLCIKWPESLYELADSQCKYWLNLPANKCIPVLVG